MRKRPGLAPAEFRKAIPRETAALAHTARRGLDASVPSCPGWKVKTLVRHVGLVHRWATEIVRTRAQRRVPFSEIPRPGRDEDPPTWLELGAAELLDQLSTLAPDERVWNWSSAPQHGRFWPRRMAHETVVHRWDAQNAHGEGAPIGPPALAADGLDEVLDVWLPSFLRDNPVSLGATVAWRCTDIEASWAFSLEGDAVTRLDPERPTDVSATGEASDLLLFVWGRIVDGAGVRISGDRSALDRLSSLGWSR